jgi:hypothetical protein
VQQAGVVFDSGQPVSPALSAMTSGKQLTACRCAEPATQFWLSAIRSAPIYLNSPAMCLTAIKSTLANADSSRWQINRLDGDKKGEIKLSK